MISLKALQKVVEYIFPQFKSKRHSRFEELFNELDLKEGNIKYKENYDININNIFLGIDERTEIVVKNLPRKISKGKILKIVEKFGELKYYYYENDFNTKYNIKTCSFYIAFKNYKSIISLYNKMINYKFKIDDIKLPIKIKYSNIQNKDNI